MFVIHCYAAVSVAMTASQYMCGEMSSTCQTMVQLFAPEEGIDCDVIVTLASTNGSKAGKPCGWLIHLLLRITSPIIMSLTLCLLWYLVVLGMDYNFYTSTVTFPAGSMNGSIMPLSSDIIDDMALEGTHNFSIEIVGVETPSGPDDLLASVVPDSADVIIMDNERTFILSTQ